MYKEIGPSPRNKKLTIKMISADEMAARQEDAARFSDSKFPGQKNIKRRLMNLSITISKKTWELFKRVPETDLPVILQGLVDDGVKLDTTTVVGTGPFMPAFS